MINAFYVAQFVGIDTIMCFHGLLPNRITTYKKFWVMHGRQTSSNSPNEILYVLKGIFFSRVRTGIMQHCKRSE
jgi:hypothetical protein